MSNSISRRTFLKCTGASVAALGAASLLGGCQQNGSATIVDVKVGDKVSNWNGLGVQLTSLFNIDTAPAQAGYEYIAVLVTVVNRTKNQTFNIGAQNLAEISAAYPVPPQENVDANFHALAAASTNLPPQGTGYLQLMLMVPKGWQQLSVTYMPTFAADKTMTFVMTAADVTRA